MNESRMFIFSLSAQEVVKALKVAYPNNVAIQAMPATADLDVLGKESRLRVSYVRKMAGSDE